MQRLSKDQIKLLKTLSNKGLSLRKIQKRTKIPLSTIQYRLNKNKGLKREKQIKIPSSDFIKGELVGSFAGDGNYYYDKTGRCSKHRIRYSLSYQKDREYANHLVSILKSMGLNVHNYIKMYKGNPSELELRVHSINFIKFIKEYIVWEGRKSYSVQLKENIKCNKNFLLGFVRGVMDTDGYVESHGIACEVTSKNLISNLKDILSSIKINPKITIRKRKGKKNLHRIRISKKYLKIYKKCIGFSNPRKMKKLVEINLK